MTVPITFNFDNLINNFLAINAAKDIKRSLIVNISSDLLE